MDNNKVLIVSFYFPPYPKVGGRRWAKFAKYLNREGYDTHVLCVTFNQDNQSPWNKDVEGYKSKVHRIRKDFLRPYYLETLPANIFQKIKWKLSYHAETLKKRTYKGNYNDPGRRYAAETRRKAKQLIEIHKYSTVIVTGGPFSVPFEIVKLKKKFPSIKFIVDIRDPWTGGMKNSLSKRQLDFEFLKEKKTYESADIITTCHQYIIDDLNIRYGLDEKLKHLSHAFDIEDFSPGTFDKKLTPDSKIITMVYAGTLYGGMEREMGMLVNFVRVLKNKDYVPLVKLYCFNGGYEAIIETSDVQDCFKYEDIISPLELSKVFADSTYILQLRPKSEEGWENFLSSKFYELLLYRKPILYFGPESTVQQFLETKKLGIWIDSYSEDTDLGQLHEKLLRNEIPSSYDVSQHEYQEEMKKLKEMLRP